MSNPKFSPSSDFSTALFDFGRPVKVKLASLREKEGKDFHNFKYPNELRDFLSLLAEVMDRNAKAKEDTKGKASTVPPRAPAVEASGSKVCSLLSLFLLSLLITLFFS